MSEALKNEIQADPQTGEIFGAVNAPGVFCCPTYERSESIIHLAGALARAQAAMRPALKASENPYFKSKYSDLAGVWEVAQGPLADNGLAVLQPISTTADGKAVQVTTLLVHTSGEWISSVSTWPAKSDKDQAVGPQALGSAATYGRRYSLSGLLNIVSEDDDGNRVEGRDARETKTHPPEPPKPPRRNQAAPAKPNPEPAPAAGQPVPPANVAQFPAGQNPPAAPDPAVHQRTELLAQVSAIMKDRLAGDKSTQAKVQLMKMAFGKEKWSEICVLPLPQLLTGLTLIRGEAHQGGVQ